MLRYSSGTRYRGDFEADQAHGQGEFSFANGDRYVGEVRRGVITGKGSLWTGDGDIYNGAFKDGAPHGSGTFTSGRGDRYVGQFEAGKRSGHGINTFSNGDEYAGGFLEDCYQGDGTFTFQDGTRYRGQFKDNGFEGAGTLTYANGDVYAGGFKRGKFWGEGTFTYADGTKYFGQFEEGFGVFHGAVTFPSGDSYVGEMRNGVPHGEGMYLGTDGSVTLQVDQATSHSATPTAGLASTPTEPATAPALVKVVADPPPVLVEIKKLRDDWLRLAENKLEQQQASAALHFAQEHRKIEEERRRLEAEKLELQEQVRKNKEDLLAELGELERQKDKLHKEEEVIVDRFTNERLKIQEERSRLEAERKRLEQQHYVKKATPEDKRRRIALVIGNGAYNRAALRNPVNDAKAMTKALTAAGFAVEQHLDVDLKQMNKAIRGFASKVTKGDVALFFYAGHGSEVNKKNYLIPVQEDIEGSEEIASGSAEADSILAKIQSANPDLTIFVLDACRSNPYAATRGASGGLVAMEGARGALIAFSTAPGSTASDGADEHSPYVKHLVRAMALQDVPMEQMFKEVRRAVVEETRGAQTPWEHSSVIGEFYVLDDAKLIQREMLSIDMAGEEQFYSAYDSEIRKSLRERIAPYMEVERDYERALEAGNQAVVLDTLDKIARINRDFVEHTTRQIHKLVEELA